MEGAGRGEINVRTCEIQMAYQSSTPHCLIKIWIVFVSILLASCDAKVSRRSSAAEGRLNIGSAASGTVVINDQSHTFVALTREVGGEEKVQSMVFVKGRDVDSYVLEGGDTLVVNHKYKLDLPANSMSLVTYDGRLVLETSLPVPEDNFPEINDEACSRFLRQCVLRLEQQSKKSKT